MQPVSAVAWLPSKVAVVVRYRVKRGVVTMEIREALSDSLPADDAARLVGSRLDEDDELSVLAKESATPSTSLWSTHWA